MAYGDLTTVFDQLWQALAGMPLSDTQRIAAGRLLEGDFDLLQVAAKLGLEFEIAGDSAPLRRLEATGLLSVSEPLHRGRVRVLLTKTGREYLAKLPEVRRRYNMERRGPHR